MICEAKERESEKEKNVNKYRAESGVFINQQRNIETAFFIFSIIKASMEEDLNLTIISTFQFNHYQAVKLFIRLAS